MEEFNILEFLKYYWNKIVFVIICTFVGLFASIIYTFKIQVPMYEAKTSLVLVNNSQENTTITQTDITINKNLVSTYREIIQSRRILSKVISNLRLDIDYEDLKNNVNVKTQQDTEIINIFVYDEKSANAKTIANEIAKVFEEEITSIYNIENVSIIDSATTGDKPYNVHALKQFILGTGLGFLISSLLIAVLYYFDDTVKSEEDIERDFKLPI